MSHVKVEISKSLVLIVPLDFGTLHFEYLTYFETLSKQNCDCNTFFKNISREAFRLSKLRWGNWALVQSFCPPRAHTPFGMDCTLLLNCPTTCCLVYESAHCNSSLHVHLPSLKSKQLLPSGIGPSSSWVVGSSPAGVFKECLFHQRVLLPLEIDRLRPISVVVVLALLSVSWVRNESSSLLQPLCLGPADCSKLDLLHWAEVARWKMSGISNAKRVKQQRTLEWTKPKWSSGCLILVVFGHRELLQGRIWEDMYHKSTELEREDISANVALNHVKCFTLESLCQTAQNCVWNEFDTGEHKGICVESTCHSTASVYQKAFRGPPCSKVLSLAVERGRANVGGLIINHNAWSALDMVTW